MPKCERWCCNHPFKTIGKIRVGQSKPYRRRITDPLKRFKGYVTVVESGCWLWSGALTNDGYGSFSIVGRRGLPAHVWAYTHFIDVIPMGCDLDHFCRNKRCVNPEHLEPVTRSVNTLRGLERQNRLEGVIHCLPLA